MLVYIILYLAGVLFSRVGQFVLSGIVLIIAGMYLYIREYKISRCFLNLRGLFSLGFVGGQGVSALKLSYLGTQWTYLTWASLFAAFAAFYLTFGTLQKKRGNHYVIQEGWSIGKNNENRLFSAILLLTGISVLFFAIEAAVLGFIPLFLRGVPHAYSVFHISGLHYFTVSCVLVPAFGVIFFLEYQEVVFWKKGVVLGAVFLSLMVPVLCVSRFQFILGVMLGVITLLVMKRENLVPYMFVPVLVLLVGVYVLLSIARSHNVEYLNSIFEMKARFPIYFSQPYIYIANNYDNFNVMVEELEHFAYGLKGLFPLWALTGMKFLFPSLVNFPLYVTKTELTTVTLFYDAYYDFGIFGVMAFSALLGGVSYFFEGWIRRTRNYCVYVLYAQMAMYLGLAFFTTWFSNPATWFYFLITGVITWFCSYD